MVPALKIEFLTTCKNRTQHLKLTLPDNLANNPQAQFIVLNYGTEDDLVGYLEASHSNEIKAGRLVLYSHYENLRFRMSHAKNMAHRLGLMHGADILVNLDADNRTNTGFAGYIERQFTRHGRNIFLSARMKKGMPRGINGRIVLTKEQFLTSGGYDELRFDGGWSSEDKHLNLRLRALGYQDVVIPDCYLDAVRHPDRMRYREWPEIEGHAGELDIRANNIGDLVVNNGWVGCGRVYRNFDFDTPIEIGPVSEPRPRVFGIGWHKTGTTSLSRALEIIGYSSWHWSKLDELRPAQAAKRIWNEAKGGGRSPTLERRDALTDFPIPFLFKQLDEAYPGSKFILTVRSDRDWLHSVVRHFSALWNPNRADWSLDPFTDRAHQIAYGRTEFEADIFLQRYRRHNAEVMAYFKGRRDDLLVMSEQTWFPLCRFLDRPIPNVPYPYLNGGLKMSEEHQNEPVAPEPIPPQPEPAEPAEPNGGEGQEEARPQPAAA